MMEELFQPTILSDASLTTLDVLSDLHDSIAIIDLGSKNSVLAI